MGVVGRYLDLLPPDACDRVRGAVRWTTRCTINESGARNLLGHAENWTWLDLDSAPVCNATEVFLLRAAAGDQLWTDEPLIGIRFAHLAKRRGLSSAIGLVRGRLERAVTHKQLIRLTNQFSTVL